MSSESVAILEDLARIDWDTASGRYVGSRIPNEIDTTVQRVADAYWSSHGRAAWCQRLTSGHALMLLEHAERMATMALRTNSIEPLRRACTTMSIAYQLTDPREAAPVVGLVSLMANGLQTSLAELAGGLVPAELMRRLEVLPAKPLELGRLGYSIRDAGDGPLFARLTVEETLEAAGYEMPPGLPRTPKQAH